ncbi:MAG: S8 family serine peptidase [Syntrophobacterales bacterium]|nr:MAG: S8 family serine peptidase [Syntrophobacterales bacterium]
MRKITLILIVQLAFFGCLFSFPIVYGGDGHSVILNGEGNIPFPYVPGEVLVKWKAKTSIHSIRQLKSNMELTLTKTFHTIEVHRLRLPPSLRIEEALAKLRGNPLVEYAEPNYIVRALVTPDDPQFNQLWGLDNTGQTGGTPDADIDAPEAWDITTGDNGVVIAVIDTGVAWKHPDLADNIWTNPGEDPWSDPNDPTTGNGDDDDGNGKNDDWRGWDFLGDDNDPTDYSNHGTHVSGTIGALGNNATGITGLNWDVSIMPLRIIGPFGYGDTAKAIDAILYAADNGAKVINASWGGGGFSQALYDAISYANDRGCLFVAAAGNLGNDNDTNPFYPASYDLPNIISVAATDNNDDKAPFSNYGATSVDVAAPGVSILSSIPIIGIDPNVNPLFSENFDSGLGNWTSWGTNNTWGISGDYYTSSPNSLADSPSGNYLDNTDSYITYNTAYNLVDKSVSMDIQLRCDLESFYDFLFIGGDLGGGYGFIPVYLLNWEGWFTDSTSGSFIQYSTDLSPLWDISNGINIGFNLYSDSSNNDDGVYIDDVTVVTQDLLITGYDYAQFQGTSMAAPHVSGLAGLILARYPAITLQALKDRILNGVDIIAGLNGMVLTNGRINAYTSLAPPTGGSGGGGGGGLCFIATAAFGSPFERHVQVLQDLRDRYLLTNSIGKAFISLYYKFSPPIADSIAKNGALRAAARVGLYPAVWFRYIALNFSHAGNITLLLSILAISAGMIYGIARYKKAALAKSIFSTRQGDYSSR